MPVRVFVPAKPIFRSRLAWLGVALIVAGLLELVGMRLFTAGSAARAAALAGLLVILFRLGTYQPAVLSTRKRPTVMVEAKP